MSSVHVAVVACSVAAVDQEIVDRLVSLLRHRRATAEPVPATAPALPDADVVILLGAAGARAAELDGADAVMSGVTAMARAGAPVLGVGDGFHLLCEWRLLDGEVRFAAAATGAVHCRVEGIPTPFTRYLPVGRQLAMTGLDVTAHYQCDDADEVSREGRVILRYCSADGYVPGAADDRAPADTVAGVCSREGNVVGIGPLIGAVATPGQGADPMSLIDSVLAWRAGTPGRIAL